MILPRLIDISISSKTRDKERETERVYTWCGSVKCKGCVLEKLNSITECNNLISQHSFAVQMYYLIRQKQKPIPNKVQIYGSSSKTSEEKFNFLVFSLLARGRKKFNRPKNLCFQIYLFV